MILAGHQPEHLPYLGFFYKIVKADKFILVDHVQYKKKNFQNRNRIRNDNGAFWLTVPVKTHDKHFQKIMDVEINNDLDWQKKHWRSIQLCYGKVPFYKEYAPLFEKIYTTRYDKLSEFNIAIIKTILEILGIKKTIYRSSDYAFTRQKTELLVEMCKELGCSTYFSGHGAKSYFVPEIFEHENLNHIYSDFKHPTYIQHHKGPFIPNLSIIDAIFNISGEKTLELLENSHE